MTAFRRSVSPPRQQYVKRVKTEGLSPLPRPFSSHHLDPEVNLIAPMLSATTSPVRQTAPPRAAWTPPRNLGGLSLHRLDTPPSPSINFFKSRILTPNQAYRRTKYVAPPDVVALLRSPPTVKIPGNDSSVETAYEYESSQSDVDVEEHYHGLPQNPSMCHEPGPSSYSDDQEYAADYDDSGPEVERRYDHCLPDESEDTHSLAGISSISSSDDRQLSYPYSENCFTPRGPPAAASSQTCTPVRSIASYHPAQTPVPPPPPSRGSLPPWRAREEATRPDLAHRKSVDHKEEVVETDEEEGLEDCLLRGDWEKAVDLLAHGLEHGFHGGEFDVLKTSSEGPNELTVLGVNSSEVDPEDRWPLLATLSPSACSRPFPQSWITLSKALLQLISDEPVRDYTPILQCICGVPGHSISIGLELARCCCWLVFSEVGEELIRKKGYLFNLICRMLTWWDHGIGLTHRSLPSALPRLITSLSEQTSSADESVMRLMRRDSENELSVTSNCIMFGLATILMSQSTMELSTMMFNSNQYPRTFSTVVIPSYMNRKLQNEGRIDLDLGISFILVPMLLSSKLTSIQQHDSPTCSQRPTAFTNLEVSLFSVFMGDLDALRDPYSGVMGDEEDVDFEFCINVLNNDKRYLHGLNKPPEPWMPPPLVESRAGVSFEDKSYSVTLSASTALQLLYSLLAIMQIGSIEIDSAENEWKQLAQGELNLETEKSTVVKKYYQYPILSSTAAEIVESILWINPCSDFNVKDVSLVTDIFVADTFTSSSHVDALQSGIKAAISRLNPSPSGVSYGLVYALRCLILCSVHRLSLGFVPLFQSKASNSNIPNLTNRDPPYPLDRILIMNLRELSSTKSLLREAVNKNLQRLRLLFVILLSEKLAVESSSDLIHLDSLRTVVPQLEIFQSCDANGVFSVRDWRLWSRSWTTTCPWGTTVDRFLQSLPVTDASGDRWRLSVGEILDIVPQDVASSTILPISGRLVCNAWSWILSRLINRFNLRLMTMFMDPKRLTEVWRSYISCDLIDTFDSATSTPQVTGCTGDDLAFRCPIGYDLSEVDIFTNVLVKLSSIAGEKSQSAASSTESWPSQIVRRHIVSVGCAMLSYGSRHTRNSLPATPFGLFLPLEVNRQGAEKTARLPSEAVTLPVLTSTPHSSSLIHYVMKHFSSDAVVEEESSIMNAPIESSVDKYQFPICHHPFVSNELADPVCIHPDLVLGLSHLFETPSTSRTAPCRDPLFAVVWNLIVTHDSMILSDSHLTAMVAARLSSYSEQHVPLFTILLTTRLISSATLSSKKGSHHEVYQGLEMLTQSFLMASEELVKQVEVRFNLHRYPWTRSTAHRSCEESSLLYISVLTGLVTICDFVRNSSVLDCGGPFVHRRTQLLYKLKEQSRRVSSIWLSFKANSEFDGHEVALKWLSKIDLLIDYLSDRSGDFMERYIPTDMDPFDDKELSSSLEIRSILRRECIDVKNTQKDDRMQYKKRPHPVDLSNGTIGDYIRKPQVENNTSGDLDWIHYEFEDEEARAHINWDKTFQRLKRKRLVVQKNLTKENVFLNTCPGESWLAFYAHCFTARHQFPNIDDVEAPQGRACPGDKVVDYQPDEDVTLLIPTRRLTSGKVEPFNKVEFQEGRR
eukprot:GHVH01008322.1.p1 GENE.GHVH01008322.1~~GHVH01008322.1.p1  ORF type:complete len:1627 (+),score=256.20 GHVH01008322.1:34-4914(+)